LRCWLAAPGDGSRFSASRKGAPLDQTQQDRLRAALAGSYDIDRELGTGGMATVYHARDAKHQRPVAVKVLRAELAVALGRDRFLREIRIVANLQHPNILPLHDSGEVEGFFYFVMPYVEGESLRTRIDREGALPIAEAARLLAEVTDALAYAHRHGIVHRDIKPENILMSGRHALVTDFGVAKAISDAAGAQDKKTTAGLALGTPYYMSPEQALADPNVDHRADIYAVGALAYELFTGKPPFWAGTAQAVLAAHVVEPAKPITDSRAELPPQLAKAVMKCLEKKPEARFQSADDLLPAFESLATPSGGLTPTGTRPIQAVFRRSPWLRRVAIAAVAIVVIGTGAGIFALVQGRGAAAAADTARPIQRLAVLPIQSLSGGGQPDPLADALLDAIITRLGQGGGTSLVPRSSVMRYRVTQLSTREIARELSADGVVEASIARSGDRIRVSVQLVDVAQDRALWSRSFDVQGTDMFSLQDSLAVAIAGGIRAALPQPSGSTP